MEQIREVIKQMISISEAELNDFLSQTIVKTFKRQELLCRPQAIPNEIFFINKGLLRVFITCNEGVEHTIHFALENQFIADYSNFIQKETSFYSLQALEETEVVLLPRSAIEWGYKNLKEGQKLVHRSVNKSYILMWQKTRCFSFGFPSPLERTVLTSACCEAEQLYDKFK